MDDLFQYLIYGVIIFSFISSFFKKKEQPKPPVPGTKPRTSSQFPREQSNVDLSQVSNKKDEYDILRELENMFKGNLPVPQQPKPKQVEQNVEYASHEIKDKDLDLVEDKRLQRNVEDKNPIGSRETYDDKMSNRKALLDLQRQKVTDDPIIEAGAKAFERVLAGPRKQRAAVTEFN
ncbi:MAG: hypothetical protein WAR59_03315, partial [Ignavibacteriaceae bacterium]